jgi:hypothetical protein
VLLAEQMLDRAVAVDAADIASGGSTCCRFGRIPAIQPNVNGSSIVFTKRSSIVLESIATAFTVSHELREDALEKSPCGIDLRSGRGG